MLFKKITRKILSKTAYKYTPLDFKATSSALYSRYLKLFITTMPIESDTSDSPSGAAMTNNNSSPDIKVTTAQGSDEEANEKPPFIPYMVPPDGGWGWVVVFGNCLMMFVTSSIMYCFGFVYIYLVEMGYHNTVVAIIPALMNGLSNLLAPLSTAFTRYYSHRRIAIVGNVLVSAGLLLCSLSQHIIWFYICYGVILGFGNALLHPQGFLLSQLYFNKKRVASNGLSMIGPSAGFMVFPVMLKYFAQEYSYEGSFLLWSGIALHGIIGASLFHPVKWHMKPQMTIPLQDMTGRPRKDNQGTEIKEDNVQESRVNSDEEYCSSEGHSSYDDSDDDKDTSDIPELTRVYRMSESQDEETIQEGGGGRTLRNDHARTRTLSYSSTTSTIFGTYDAIEGFGSHSTMNEKSSITQQRIVERIPGRAEVKEDKHCLVSCIIFPKIENIIKFSLLKHPAFIVSSFASVCNRTVYLCFVTYLPAIAKDINIDQNAPYLFTCIAIFELLAKITMSLISDRGWMQRRYYVILGSFLSSLAICSITFANGFWSAAFSCSLYGFCVGTVMSVAPILLVEYLGVKLLPSSYGLLLFMNGVAGLIIFVLTGMMNDIAGHYKVTYWAIGLLVLIPGVLWSLVNVFMKRSSLDVEVILPT